ncbi:siderophore-interacting protein [Streptomyces subrutilus]|uniref:Siderophore-interacting protein n=1 Tax=Streptomyces subrutilus TaxID=36818 RepID=A0A5P2UMX3_9ACTN|nr:siderophore-interacting protein [Streptomyces subrutilus]QEU80498.1 siderophore-interacting protein [Streptomyces subrutilus]GGZ91493.1 siderophore-interacting protein [Streptomyces subrutilus]
MTATAPGAPAVAHFRFFALEVLRTRRLGRSFLRVTFGGESLAAFRSGGFDQSLSLFLPPAHREHTELPSTAGDTWFAAWRAMPPEQRPVMRSYTVREQRRGPGGGDEVDIDFVLHGDASPASRWAGRAAAGHRVLAIGPAVAENKSVRFQPPPGTDALFLYADETALPAAAAILERLPADARVRAWFEVPHAQDRLALATPADADITWIVREGAGRDRAERVLDVLRAAEPPRSEGPYVWLAGEAGTVRAVRRHFVRDRAVDRRRVRFTGYWRLGASEEQLLAEASAGRAPSEDPASEL